MAVTYLSTSVTSDAAGAIGYGATAPSGTDRTSAIQAVFTAASSGDVIVWDVAVGLSAPILIPSYVTVYAPASTYGAILRAAANCPMFRNKGITTDATTSKQKTFGKLDAAHSGNAAYRVLDPVNYCNDREIAVVGGTWNGNYAQQTGHGFTSTYGFLSTFQFWGVEDVLLQDVTVYKPKGSVVVHFANWHRVTVRNVVIDCGPLSLPAASSEAAWGGLQMNAPGSRLRVDTLETHCSDDHIALNADDSGASPINSGYAGGASVCTPGVNWPQCGDITDAYITNHRISDGIEGLPSQGALRLFSTVHLVDNVLVDGQWGAVRGYAYQIGAHNSGWQISGTGNLGSNIEIRRSTVELSSPISGYLGVFDIRGGGGSVAITGRVRGTIPASGLPDVSLSDGGAGAGTLRQLSLEGDYYDDGTGGNVLAAQIKLMAAVTRIVAETRSGRASSVSAIGSPVLWCTTGASLSELTWRGDLDRASNVAYVDHCTVGTILLVGAHRHANGGSPLYVDTGGTVTNLLLPALAYVAGNGAKAGSGTLTNNGSYADT